MFNVVLVEPEIPPNTGNIIRLCANTGCTLHLVRPLGFTWDDRRLKRAGLDYHEWANVRLHDNLATCLVACGARAFAFTTRAAQRHDAVRWQPGDALVFGPESRGLGDAQRALFAPERQVRIAMQADSRSLNLANAVAVGVYEAWRQQGFAGAT